ncbi:MAG: GDSL-type esterase/lipase family protein [Lachnospiraceae bacterium]|nr:GDSL-type esterase/lipase family protein [Lachnospiraceae bacterium]
MSEVKRQEKNREAGILLLMAIGIVLFFFGNPVFVKAASQTSVSQETELAAPVLRSAKAGTGKITVSWKKVTGAQYYLIYRKESSGKYSRIAKQKASAGVSYVDKTVQAGRTYIYTVKAYAKTDGEKVFSGYDASGVTATAKVPTVTLSKITAATGKITVVWEAVSDISLYRVYRKEGNGKYRKLADVKAGTLSYVDDTVEMGHVYTYTVRAIYKTENGDSVSGKVDKTGLTATAVVKKTSVQNVETACGHILITWKAKSGVDGYYVYRREGTSGKYKKLAKLANSTQDLYWDRTAEPGVSYTYAVYTYVNVDDGIVKSKAATWDNAVFCAPGSAILTGLTRGTSKDTLTWKEVSGADGYIVYKKNSKTGNTWTRVKKVSAGTTKASLVRDSGVTTTYTVRAYVKAGNKTVYSTYKDTLDNSIRKYTKSTILFEGDSITKGTNGKGTVATVTFPQRVAQITGAACTNAAVGGSTLAKRSSSTNSVVTRAQSGTTSYEGYSVICIAAGTNDYARSIRLGSLGDTSTSTFYGALETIFQIIEEQNPDATVVLITPTYRGRLGTDWSKTGMNCKNSAGYTLEDYAEALRNIAKKYGATVYDSVEAGVITADNWESALYDGLHPVEETYCQIGKSLASFLKKNVLTAD